MLQSELIILTAQKFSDYDSDGADDSEKYTRVDAEDWVDYLNTAQRILVLIRPDSHIKFASMLLTANETRHSLPDECVQFIEVTRNMGSDGSTPGPAIYLSNKDVLRDFISTWQTADGETEIELYAYDPKTPRYVWSYPRAHATTAVYWEIVYSYMFTAAVYASIASTDVEAEDIFINPLIELMIAEAFDVDTDSLYPMEQAAAHRKKAYDLLGIEFQTGEEIRKKTKDDRS